MLEQRLLRPVILTTILLTMTLTTLEIMASRTMAMSSKTKQTILSLDNWTNSTGMITDVQQIILSPDSAIQGQAIPNSPQLALSEPVHPVSGTWSAAGGPYIFTETMTILSGTNLLIEAGTEIHFAQYQSLDVYGNLTIEGTAAAPVRLRATDHAESTDLLWGGIRFYDCEECGKISYAHIRSAWNGISVYANKQDAAPRIEDTTIISSLVGIYVQGDAAKTNVTAAPLIRDNILLNNNTGISVVGTGGGSSGADGFAQPEIRNNHIEGGSSSIRYSSYGGSGVGAYGNALGTISDNVFTNSSWSGIQINSAGGSYGCFPAACLGGRSSPLITNNRFEKTGLYGVVISSYASSSLGYSNRSEAQPILANNTFLGIHGDGINITRRTRTTTKPIIVHNTFYDISASTINDTSEAPNLYPIYNNLVVSATTGFQVTPAADVNTECNLLWQVVNPFVAYPAMYGELNQTNWRGDPIDAFGNLQLDPALLGLADGNIHLQATSHAVDAACAHLSLPQEDIDHEQRLMGFGYDIGADELTMPIIGVQLEIVPAAIKLSTAASAIVTIVTDSGDIPQGIPVRLDVDAQPTQHAMTENSSVISFTINGTLIGTHVVTATVGALEQTGELVVRPSPYIVADPPTTTVDSGSVISVTIPDAAGDAMTGLPITFSTQGGTFRENGQANYTTIVGATGHVVAQLQATKPDKIPVQVTVDGEQYDLYVIFLAGEPAKMQIATEGYPNPVPGQRSHAVWITVYDQYGNAIPTIEVNLTVDMGTITSTVVTNEQGIATAVLTTDKDIGQIRLTASAGNLVYTSMIENNRLRIFLPYILR